MLIGSKRKQQFQDLMIGDIKRRFFFLKPEGTFYATKVKQRNGRVDLELSLPPSLESKLAHAIKGGKQIRLFVPNDSV